jgi:hypothetical protein
MSKRTWIAGGVAVLALLGAIQPASAVCVASRAFDSAGEYVYRADQVVVWGGTYQNGGVTLGPSPSIDLDARAVYWGVGGGNPADLAGNDSGSQPAHGYWLFYGSTGGGQYYAHYIAGAWSGDTRIDGCIDNTGSNPALADTDQCMVVLIEDENASGESYFALLSDQADTGGNYQFEHGETILQQIPAPKVTASNRVSNNQVDVTVELDPPLAGPASGIYTTCGGNLITGYQVRKQSVPRNAPAPTARDKNAWQIAGPVQPVASPSSFSVTCGGDEDVYVATELLFESGFSTLTVSKNSSAVQCGPTLANPVRPIQPPRGRPTPSGPRDDNRTPRR